MTTATVASKGRITILAEVRAAAAQAVTALERIFGARTKTVSVAAMNAVIARRARESSQR